MVSDSQYEHYYSEFYNENPSKSYFATSTCPLFKSPEVIDEEEALERRRNLRSLKNQCIDKITSYIQVCHLISSLIDRKLRVLFV